jgi:hypothetical protein
VVEADESDVRASRNLVLRTKEREWRRADEKDTLRDELA